MQGNGWEAEGWDRVNRTRTVSSCSRGIRERKRVYSAQWRVGPLARPQAVTPSTQASVQKAVPIAQQFLEYFELTHLSGYRQITLSGNTCYLMVPSYNLLFDSTLASYYFLLDGMVPSNNKYLKIN